MTREVVRDDTDRVSQIEPRERVVVVCRGGDPFDVEQLARPVQHRGEEDDPDVVVCRQRRLHVGGVDRPAVTRVDGAELLVGVDPPLTELCPDRVVVRREVEIVDEHRRRVGVRVRAGRGPGECVEERPQQRVDVRRRGVGDDHLRGVGADQRREQFPEVFREVEPVRVGLLPPADRQLAPLLAHPVETLAGRLREQPQRVTVDVQLLVGHVEPIPERREWVCRVQLGRDCGVERVGVREQPVDRR